MSETYMDTIADIARYTERGSENESVAIELTARQYQTPEYRIWADVERERFNLGQIS